MATTTNYGWETPDDTDLVKDGASAIRTLGSAIDTTVFNNASAGIAKTILDAKGDLISATAADTPARLAVGTNGYFLSANSSTSTGLEWVAAPTSSQAWTQVGSATSLSGNASVTVSGITNADKLMINLTNVASATSGGWFSLHINDDSNSSRYYHFGLGLKSQSTYTSGIFDQFNEGSSVPTSGINMGYLGAANKYMAATVFIYGGNATGTKVFQGQSGIGDTNNANRMAVFGGYYTQTGTISSISIKYNAGSNNFSDGTMYVWKSA